MRTLADTQDDDDGLSKSLLRFYHTVVCCSLYALFPHDKNLICFVISILRTVRSISPTNQHSMRSTVPRPTKDSNEGILLQYIPHGTLPSWYTSTTT